MVRDKPLQVEGQDRQVPPCSVGFKAARGDVTSGQVALQDGVDLFGLPAATSMPTDYFIIRFSKIVGDDEKGLSHLAAKDH